MLFSPPSILKETLPDDSGLDGHAGHSGIGGNNSSSGAHGNGRIFAKEDEDQKSINSRNNGGTGNKSPPKSKASKSRSARKSLALDHPNDAVAKQ